MKYILLLFTIAFIFLSGCAGSQSVLASGEINENYSMSLILSEESTSNGIQKNFMTVVTDHHGAEKSRLDINGLFGDETSGLNEGSLYFYDYNGDGNLEIAIGIPEATVKGMYRYALISVDEAGSQVPLQIEGYKEQGYLYSIDDGNYPLLACTKNVDGRYEIAVGIMDNGVAAPARYVWNGDKFQFVNEFPFTISMEQIPNHQNTHLAIEQTEFLNPSKPYDTEFDIYKSYILGNFDAVVYKNGKEISRLNINSLFDETAIGWAGPFAIIFNDYNSDGMSEFAIGQPVDGSADFKYVLITVDTEGVLSRLNAKGFKDEGYIYNSSETAELSILPGSEAGISVVLSDGGWKKGVYVWNETEKMFSFNYT